MSQNKASSLQISGIGSLPFQSTQEALIYSFEHSLPFLPELPLVFAQEKMKSMAQKLISEESEIKYSCEDLFLKNLNKKIHPYAKIQFMGPVTAVKILESTQKLSQREKKLCQNKIINYLNHLAEKIIQLGIRPVLFLDEPLLDEKSLPLLTPVLEALQNGLKGLHCCQRFNSELIENLELDLLSYDAFLIPSEVVRRISAKNRQLSFWPGIIDHPPQQELRKFDLNLYSQIPISGLSATCGLAGYQKEECQLILRHLKAEQSKIASSHFPIS